jgi:hypothetical protein
MTSAPRRLRSAVRREPKPRIDISRHIAMHVFTRCGRAVTRLVESGLLPRPELPNSEIEVREWWLVSAELARCLWSAGLPVLRLDELFMWGRATAGVPVRDDPELRAAIRQAGAEQRVRDPRGRRSQ